MYVHKYIFMMAAMSQEATLQEEQFIQVHCGKTVSSSWWRRLSGPVYLKYIFV